MPKLYSKWQDVPKSAWKWPNFSPEEIASNIFVNGKNGPKIKGPILIDERSLDMLQKLRTKLGKPFIINSAYRDPEYNKAIGGAKNSQHMRGQAFDISMANHNPAEFEAAAIEVGFKGIGHYPGSNFMHIDTRVSNQVVKWKGTGANNAWFPKSKTTTFSGDEPKPDKVMDILKKAEVAVPLGVTASGGVTALAQGNEAFQWVLAGGFALAIVGAVVYFIWRLNRRTEI